MQTKCLFMSSLGLKFSFLFCTAVHFPFAKIICPLCRLMFYIKIGNNKMLVKMPNYCTDVPWPGHNKRAL